MLNWMDRMLFLLWSKFPNTVTAIWAYLTMLFLLSIPMGVISIVMVLLNYFKFIDIGFVWAIFSGPIFGVVVSCIWFMVIVILIWSERFDKGPPK